ncbi:TPA: glycosyltransferase family 4 protein, partial [Aeromonas veronii]|nr:glycosyltransferase family 4 protein [Aeromonas veronii]
VNYRSGEFEGVALEALPAPKKKSLEAILHSLLAVFYCRSHACDLVHVHAIGPGLVVPLLRLLGKRVVFTHHGPDYDRQKWGALAKWVLRLGERWAVRYASEVIVISEVINEAIRRQYDRQDAHLIYNGVKRVELPAVDKRELTLARFGLTAGSYLVAVGRFVEEKGLHDLIAAYRQLDTEMPLVLVGDTDHPTPYSEHLQRIADETPGVIRTGFLNGEALISVFSQAALFAMPSYHEGLPIALLEALSFSLPVVVSDIPANLAVALQQECYFPVGDVSALAERLNTQLTRGKVDYSDYLQRYDWQRIAGQTMAVYRKALGIPAGENQ